MTPITQAEFQVPGYSLFPQPHEVKMSCEIGDINLVDYYDLGAGESLVLPVQQLTRFASLAAPTMHNFRMNIWAISVPYRLAMPMRTMSYMDSFESFFNYRLSDDERPLMPKDTFADYLTKLASFMGTHNVIGSLYDQAQYPIFVDCLRKLQRNQTVAGLASSDRPNISQDDIDLDGAEIIVDFTYQGKHVLIRQTAESVETSVPIATTNTLCSYLVAVCSLGANATSNSIATTLATYWEDPANFQGDARNLVPGIDPTFDTTANTYTNLIIQSCLDLLGLKIEQAVDRYFNYLFSRVLLGIIRFLDPTEVSDVDIAHSPIFAYWGAIYDWFINTNLQSTIDKATWLNTYLDLQNGSPRAAGFVPFRSYWEDDYFTSAFLSSDMPAETLTANMTIPDLRTKNVFQQFREKLLYAGRRYWDQLKAIRGVNPPAKLLDRSQVLGSVSFNINIEDISQTSSGNELSSLGDLAGQALSVGQNYLCRHTAQENEIVLILMRIRPTAIYDQQVNKLLLKTSPYDFLIPEFASVGEQKIQNIEIYPSLTKGHETFGFTRRYAEYMFTPSHVSGEFRTSLDYWHAAREFDELPTLNENFAQVTPADAYDRIFAVPGASEHVYCFFYFDAKLTRPLSRFIHYHL